jgi:ATP-binding cassette, subfamily B, bacterial
MTILSRRPPEPVAQGEEPSHHSPFEPLATTARYRAPKATIDPDQSKTWLRRAWPIVKSHWRMFATSLVLSFVALVLQVQIPKLLEEAIDNSLVLHHVPLSHYVKIVFILAAIAGVAGYISRYFLMRTAYEMEFDLRNIIYSHLTKMSFPFYDRVQSGQLISRANSDIRSVQMYLTFAPSILVQCSVAVVAFAYMLSINVPLALVAMIPMPFVYLLGVQMRKTIFPVSWLIQSRLADVATIVDENINGVRVVKSFAAEQRELTTLGKAADRLQWSYIKDAYIRAKFTPTVQNLPQIGLALVVLFGGWLVVHGKLQVGAITAFSLYIVMLQAPFQMLGMIIMMGQRASASSQRIYEILDEVPTVVDRPGAVDLVECRGDVRFESVKFSYAPENPLILDDFGKSTVARLLPRFYDVTGGRVVIDDHDVRDLTLVSLRASVGIVLDEPFLFSASIRDNIAYGAPNADFADIEAAAKAAGADGFVGELPMGYETVVGERGYTLSGGQRQRIAIARTLLVNPPILILDDATSAIDVQVELTIHGSLRKLMEGRTTLIIAHRLSTISLADRVLLMDGGKIVADGTHAELMETVPLYADVLAQSEEELALRAQDAAAAKVRRDERNEPGRPRSGFGAMPGPGGLDAGGIV